MLDEAGITVNRNTIPFDTEAPYIASGIRIGTPALTTRGMEEGVMRLIGDLIHRVLTHPDDASVRSDVRGIVRELCAQFPLYG
jgi:glycine hydroxymethyltransferase